MAHHEDSGRRELARTIPADIPVQYYSDDEISLLDLWNVLIRRWYWIAGVFLMTVLLGLTYALTRVPVYEYSHAIEIGTQVVRDEQRVIESPNSVAAKLEQNYVPSAIRVWLAANPDAEWRPEVRTSVPSNADIVVLEVSGPKAREAAYVEILTEATAQLQRDHQRIIDTIRQQLTVELTQARNTLSNLEQEVEDLRSQLGRVERQEALLTDEIDELKALLTDEIDELKALLDGAESSREAAGRNPGGAADAMTMLMLSNEIRAARERLSELRIQLEIELPNRREQLESQIGDKKREMEVQRGEVETVQTRLDNLSWTQPLSEPQQSLQPVGTGKTSIVASSLALGGIFGVFAAFFAEFVHAANRRRRETGTAETES